MTIAMPARRTIAEDAIWVALADVPDPEIPSISVVDLGVVRSVAVDRDSAPRRDPAHVRRLSGGRDDARGDRGSIGRHPAAIEVEVTFAEPWTSDRITPQRPGTAPCRRLRATGAGACHRPGGEPDRAGATCPLSVLWRVSHAPRQRVRPDPVPIHRLLPRLPRTVRAVQDRLSVADHDAPAGVAGVGDRSWIVGIVGAGTMGAGIAQVALQAGHEVRLHDLDPTAFDARPNADRRGPDETSRRRRSRAGRGRRVRRVGPRATSTVVADLETLSPTGRTSSSRPRSKTWR